MPVTAGHVPGMTSGLRVVRMDPGRFHGGRWFLLAEGLLVSAFGIAGLVSAALHPHAGPTGAPVFGLAATPLYSGMLLAFGVAAMACAQNRRAAITVTALSAVAYTILLFISSVATARDKPTPLGFHAAEVLLHGVLAVVNLALLMWLIPDELGGPGPCAAPTARPRPRSATALGLRAGHEAGFCVPEHGFRDDPRATPSRSDARAGAGRSSKPTPTGPRNERAVGPQRRELNRGEGPRDSGERPVLSRGAVVAVAVLAAVVGIVIWMRRR